MGYQHERVSNITYDKFEDIMRKFSIVTFFEDKFSFDKEYAHATIKKLNLNTINRSYSPEELISDLELAFSLWVNDSGLISFAHRSIQEYFAALYIKDLNDQSKDLMYKKILERADKNNNSDMFNIIRILDEIDNDYYLKNYYLPVLTEFENKLKQEQLNFEFIQLFFSICIVAEEDCHLVVIPSAGKILNLIEPIAKTYDLYLNLKNLIMKLKPISDNFNPNQKTAKLPKNLYLLKNAKNHTINLINNDPSVTMAKNRIFEVVTKNILIAERQLKNSKDKTNEILSMI